MIMDKMVVLDSLHKEHIFPISLYSRIRKNLKSKYVKDVQKESEFVMDLPLTLKQELARYVYESIYTKVDFLSKKSTLFISWICPVLKTYVT